MSWHEFTIRFQTPAFLGQDPPHGRGGDPIAFPVPSLRGALRFWLRALLGAFVTDLNTVHALESRVFGTASGTTGTPSPILLRAPQPVPVNEPTNDVYWLKPSQSRDYNRYDTYYLLGQGLWVEKRLSRRYVQPETPVTLRVKNTGDPACADLFLAALWALRTFGGLGGRARRGFGTLEIITPPEVPHSSFDPAWFGLNARDGMNRVMPNLRQAIGNHPSAAIRAPKYPCFAHPHYAIGDFNIRAKSVADAMARTGRLLREFYRERGAPSPEYEYAARPYLSGGSPDNTPFIRGAMGLPVNYGDHLGPHGSQRNAVVEPVLDGEPTRRASPLWLRTRYDGHGWKLQWLLFTAEWLPKTAKLRIRDTIDKDRQSKPVQPPDWSAIVEEATRWLDYVKDRQG